MNVRNKTLALLTVYLLLLSSSPIVYLHQAGSADPSYATLTGVAFDSGRDTDADGKFNYLEIAVEANVSVAGYYRLEALYLGDQFGHWLYLTASDECYLSIGLQYINLSFSGIVIHAEQFNPTSISEIRLYDQLTYSYLYEIRDVLLSRIYNYAEFDTGASLTGHMSSQGFDADGDGLFNSLHIEVEINVTDAATYEVYIWDLYGDVHTYLSNQSTGFLLPGIQTVSVPLHGAKISASHGNISMIYEMRLSILDDSHHYSIDSLYNAPMDRIYSYNEFDPLAFLTGNVLDEGLDNDEDGFFDYLQISVEVNVTDAGYYSVDVQKVSDNSSGSVWVSSGMGQSLDVGLHLMTFTVPGPRIYGAQVDPTYIGPVRLHDLSTWILLDEYEILPLAGLYHYYQFESHAFFTGVIRDRGVDTDGDSLFNYLEVGVEVNVTEAGTYVLSGAGLAEKLDNTTRSIYLSPSQQFVSDLNLGLHTINFTFPGPMIAYHYINPMNITNVSLAERSPHYYGELDYISEAALSTTYSHTQFNAPFTDMDLELTVYPNATVGVSGLANATHTYSPYYYPPRLNATLGFSTSGGFTAGSSDGSMVLPTYPYQYSQFPYNSTIANFLSVYDNGMLNAQLNASVLVPQLEGTDGTGRPIIPIQLNSSDLSFLGTYSNGGLAIDLHGQSKVSPYYASQFPFNATDVTVLADYGDKGISGNITFHAVSGLPLGDVIVHFSGNKTEFSLTGHINAIYGTYSGLEINATTLEQMLAEFNTTIPGHGANSLYNMTHGMIDCTALNTTKTPIDAIGARIDYNATLHGNFTKALAAYLSNMLFGPYAPEEAFSIVYTSLDAALSSAETASLELNYWHSSHIASADLSLTCDVKAFWNRVSQSIPPTVPSEYVTQVETWLRMANATASALQSLSIEAEYSSAAQQLDLHASLKANVTQLKNEIIPILPDAVPPELRFLVESCVNTTYCTLKLLNISCNYADNMTNFNVEWMLENDSEAELNHLKTCYIEYLKLYNPYAINWQIQMLNMTEIDISNLKADLRQGTDWMTLTFGELKLHAPVDAVDTIRFKLYNWLQMTSQANIPKAREKLKISVIGGSNATHTVLLSAASTAATPDTTSLNYQGMVWENVSANSLKDLLFKIAFQGVVDYLGGTFYVPIFTNSTVSNFEFNPALKSVGFNVTGAVGKGFFNATIPKALLYAAPEEWVVTIDGMPLTIEEFNLTENAEYVFIYLNYSHSSHQIEIMGTWIVTELPPSILPLIMLMSVLVAVILVIKQRKSLRKLKTKYQSVVYKVLKPKT